MTDKLRIKVAAAVTVLFLAAISAAGVLAHSSSPPNTGSVSPAALTAQPQEHSSPGPAPTSPDFEHD